MSHPLAVITGASAGIGLELARLFAKQGYDLIIVARSVDKLNSVAAELSSHGGSVHCLAQDLAQPGSAEALYEQVKAMGRPVDVLVNNAGVGAVGFFTKLSVESQMNMLHLNVVSLTHLSRLFAEDMVTRGSGRILNVASTAAFQPGPRMAVYFASKAYVLSLSEALANELQAFGVTVTALCPGPTSTEFVRTAGIKEFTPGSMMSRIFTPRAAAFRRL